MFVYGPVPSRRLGRSLGVSPIPPKTCSYTCVYCQLGRTTHLQIKRESFFPKEDILAEIISTAPTAKTDFVTFVGDGEPTLNRDLGWLIQQTKKELHLPVAVITNGSLLFQKDVREDLCKADVVIPTLDAGNEKTFIAVNRPHKGIGFDAMIQGLVDFRHEYSGQLWVEVMLVKDLNDTEKELQSIKHAIDMINPDRVYTLTPIRPPAENWVKPSDAKDILKAQEIIGETISVAELETGKFGLEEFSDARKAILEIGSRHPLRRKQAEEIEKSFSEADVVGKMLEDKELVSIEYNGEEYLLPGSFVMGKQDR
ncbi:MAG: radical SAM protein [candidate division Zixibacteria bacterium]|nr:radical SAM protein [candidate division Zixibacteria bacterium]